MKWRFVISWSKGKVSRMEATVQRVLIKWPFYYCLLMEEMLYIDNFFWLIRVHIWESRKELGEGRVNQIWKMGARGRERRRKWGEFFFAQVRVGSRKFISGPRLKSGNSGSSIGLATWSDVGKRYNFKPSLRSEKSPERKRHGGWRETKERKWFP